MTKLISELDLGMPVFVLPTASMFEVCKAMRTYRTGAVVVTRTGDAVEAVLTERDIIWGLDQIGIEYMRRKAGEEALQKPITCDQSETVEHAVKVMRANRIRHLPVTDDGRPVAMLGAIAALQALGVVEQLNINE